MKLCFDKFDNLEDMDKFLETACQNWVKKKEVMWTEWSLEAKQNL